MLASQPTPSSSIPTILIVEDDVDTGEMLEMLLSAEGYRVLWAQSGAEGLRLVEEEPVSVMLLDLRLPDMDGLTVGERVRAGIRPHMPIIIASANHEPDHLMRVQRADATDYIRKPFTPELLLERVRGMIQANPSTEWESGS